MNDTLKPMRKPITDADTQAARIEALDTQFMNAVDSTCEICQETVFDALCNGGARCPLNALEAALPRGGLV
jgi:hypothetical protein